MLAETSLQKRIKLEPAAEEEDDQIDIKYEPINVNEMTDASSLEYDRALRVSLKHEPIIAA